MKILAQTARTSFVKNFAVFVEYEDNVGRKFQTICLVTCNKKITHTWRTWDKPQNFLLANLKNQNFEKMRKKLLEISSFYTCVPKITIIWVTVPEIPSEAFFCHFGPFFALYPNPLPPNNPQNQNFGKMKKASGDAIMLNLCNKKNTTK